MLKKTCLHQAHVDAGGRMVDFGGWEMPLHYGSQLDEHHIVRREAGMFDVSHMTVVDIAGDAGQPKAYLKYLLANDIERAALPGQAVYSCMLNHDAGIIDDLIAYWVDGDNYRLVVNAATRDKDLQWMHSVAGDFGVTLTEREDLAMIAVQGPQARERAAAILPDALRNAALGLKPFHATGDGDWFVARTGYTGEDGWEIMLNSGDAADFWSRAQAAGIAPCGLGARDTLRLEAGLNLYGSDMDETTTPDESNLTWTVAIDDDRDFAGKKALMAAREKGGQRKLVGLLLTGRGVLRDHQEVFAGGDAAVGEITSGGYSPTLERSIAMARISGDIGDSAEVAVRNRRLPVSILKPAFVRRGKTLIEID